MLKGPFLLLALHLLITTAFSQQTIKGRVVVGKTGDPVAGSSVFVSNTSKGTISDKDGNFELTDIPAGKHDLVISSVGYETNVFSFSSDQLPLKLRIEMQVRVRELANVTVEPFVEETWERWGSTFLINFIGQTPNAGDCRVKNYKSIRFRYYRKSNRLVAFSDEPLVVENKALGYRIIYQLENFEVNFNERSSAFAGYPLFEEMEKGNKPKAKWVRARDKAYYGSMMHFMRAIYTNTLHAEGFEARRMVRSPNLEKERVKKIFRQNGPALSGKAGGATITFGQRGIDVNSKTNSGGDSAEYYNRIIQQKDYIDTYGQTLLSADSLVAATQGDYRIIYFDDYLSVTYKNEIEDKAYLKYFRETRSPAFQTSQIWLVNKQAVAIDANGNYTPPQEVYAMSYWGWSEKVAEMLPLDFIPSDRRQ